MLPNYNPDSNPPSLPEPLAHCVSIDLEVNPDSKTITAIGAFRPDLNQPLSQSAPLRLGEDAIQNLNRITRNADFILGHNILDFDLPHLQHAGPDAPLLQLPVIDTLRLNPLAFPRNPYHHLVKHYKDPDLLRSQRNNPYLDSILALNAFQNQIAQFQDPRTTNPLLLDAWHFLTADSTPSGRGMDFLCSFLRQAPTPTPEAGHRSISHFLAEKACPTQLNQFLRNPDNPPWPTAFALAWISAAGTDSAPPPWVIYQFPDTLRIIRQLRQSPCETPHCPWCSIQHNAVAQLKRRFNYQAFRPLPAGPDGKSLQEQITSQAMTGQHLLAVLPTGIGKSVCYQIPALANYEQSGSLTLVISPLVALMADQVNNLLSIGIPNVDSINGLLTMPQRANTLDRIANGNTAILLMSPEQLRNQTVITAIRQRSVASVVLDEAHCLSKWGHDFRPDYRYIANAITEHIAQNGSIPAILCLTATAKPQVQEEIVQYFQDNLKIEIQTINGGAQRPNLDFQVVPLPSPDLKPQAILQVIQQVIQDEIPTPQAGSGIIYCATRRTTETLARFLTLNGINTLPFHAGLSRESRIQTQNDFLDNTTQFITATNAFGMGIDKPDIRLVLHADIPGSLENYLQEAGRAGRDANPASCVLLYSPDDVEQQFKLNAHSRLNSREINKVLQALRAINRRRHTTEPIVTTPAEIFRDNPDPDFRRDSLNGQSPEEGRIITAIAWLEEASLLSRKMNRNTIHAGSLKINTIHECMHILNRDPQLEPKLKNAARYIVQSLLNVSPTDIVNTDSLIAQTGLRSSEIRELLLYLKNSNIISEDLTITAYVHHGIANSSRARFDRANNLETDLIRHLQEANPDQQIDQPSQLHLRRINQAMLDLGHQHSLPHFILKILQSIAGDGLEEENPTAEPVPAGRGSIRIRQRQHEILSLTLRRSWSNLAAGSRHRRLAAQTILHHLLAALPQEQRGADLLVHTTQSQLIDQLNQHLELQNVSNKPLLLRAALLWLHDQEIIRLNQGFAILRPAITVQLANSQRRWSSQDHLPLEIHYQEQTLQVHIMAQYAEQGAQDIAHALRLAMDYFSMPEDDFINRWLAHQKPQLKLQTTPQSYEAIVASLHNPAQRRIVADDRENTNVLILAGPGSGKTRTLVHRIAYLIRVRREPPDSIIALAYNRHAAAQIRRRLYQLIGEDANHVLSLTLHSLAMRLTGASFAQTAERPDSTDFDQILKKAAAILQSGANPDSEVSDARDRLLAGFRWIMVDEYQDIDQTHYQLISALAGRTHPDIHSRINLLAVGDDDQNIYSFRGAATRFIRQFESEYRASAAFLTENYRSTANIIDAANSVIQPAPNRMKEQHPITINSARRHNPPGGTYAALDPIAGGRVHLISLPHHPDFPQLQAIAALNEIKRINALNPDSAWNRWAVFAREWNYLQPLRALCQLQNIPAQLAREDFNAFWHLRETQSLLHWLNETHPHSIDPTAITHWLNQQPHTPWSHSLSLASDLYSNEYPDHTMPTEHFREWLAEWNGTFQQQQQGILLSSAHGAKGLEFDHVIILDGAWNQHNSRDDRNANRRLFYVAMTRARLTLSILNASGGNPFIHLLQNHHAVHMSNPPLPETFPPELRHSLTRLNPSQVNLSFPARYPLHHRIHPDISRISPGDTLAIDTAATPWLIRNPEGQPVGQLAKAYRPPPGLQPISATAFAVIVWQSNFSEPQYRRYHQLPHWEIIIPEITFAPH